MKITFIQSSLWLSGGARIIIEHANQLDLRGHQVAIVIPKTAIDPEMKAAILPGVEIVEAAYPLSKPDIRKTSTWDKIRLTLAMIKAVPRSDIIIATHTPTTVVSLVASHLLRRGVPVWFYQDYPEMFAGRKLEGFLLKQAMRWHRGALVVSKFSAQELVGFSRGEVRYVGQILNDYDLFSAQADQVLKPGFPKRLMYVGDFRPRKGLKDFIAAIEMVHSKIVAIEVTLVLKEEGSVDLKIPYNIVWRPDPGKLARCYGESDVFISSSWHESFGLPPLEAMACGTPVVLTDSGGVRDYARNNENCLMVAPGQPQLLADAILRVLTEPDLAARLRVAGPATASEFTVEKAAERMEGALKYFLSS